MTKHTDESSKIEEGASKSELSNNNGSSSSKKSLQQQAPSTVTALSKTATRRKWLGKKLSSGWIELMGYNFLLLAIVYSVYEAIRVNEIVEDYCETFFNEALVTKAYSGVCEEVNMTTEAIAYTFGSPLTIYCAPSHLYNTTERGISTIKPIGCWEDTSTDTTRYCYYATGPAESSSSCLEFDNELWSRCEIWDVIRQREPNWYDRLQTAPKDIEWLPDIVPTECQLFSEGTIKLNFVARAVIEPVLLLFTLIDQGQYVPLGSPAMVLFVPAGIISYTVQMAAGIVVAILILLLTPRDAIVSDAIVSKLAAASLCLWIMYLVVNTYRWAGDRNENKSVQTTRLAALFGVHALLLWDTTLAALSYTTGNNGWAFLLVAADLVVDAVELVSLYTSSGSWYDSGSLYIGALAYCAEEQGKSIRKRLEKVTWKGEVIVMLPTMLGSEVAASVLADLVEEFREGPLIGGSWHKELDANARADAPFKAALYVPKQMDKKLIFMLDDGVTYIKTEIGTLKVEPSKPGMAVRLPDTHPVGNASNASAKKSIKPMLLN